MRMIKFPGILAGLAAVALAAPAVGPEMPRMPAGEVAPGRARQRKRAVRVAALGAPRKAIRSRWKAMQRKRRPNRLHISRRTRRKHRRAG